MKQGGIDSILNNSIMIYLMDIKDITKNLDIGITNEVFNEVLPI